jgi:uncharacterized protein YcfL
MKQRNSIARPRVALLSVAAGLAGLTLTGCKSTYDASLATSAETVAVTTTTLPVGTVAELLPLMLAEVKALSERVAASNDAKEAATRIEQYWAAMKDEISADHPELVPDFEFVVRRSRAAADRKRPADADRAYRNLQALSDAILP